MEERNRPWWPTGQGRMGVEAPIVDLVRRLTVSGHLTGAPAKEEEIEKVERRLGVRFPADYRYFLHATGGESQTAGLFRLSELLSLNEQIPLFQWFRGVIGIANEGFIVTALDYRRGPIPTVVSLGLSSSDEADINPEAETFTQWLECLLPPSA